jgi:hypothetical protein
VVCSCGVVGRFRSLLDVSHPHAAQMRPSGSHSIPRKALVRPAYAAVWRAMIRCSAAS